MTDDVDSELAEPVVHQVNIAQLVSKPQNSCPEGWTPSDGTLESEFDEVSIHAELENT